MKSKTKFLLSLGVAAWALATAPTQGAVTFNLNYLIGEIGGLTVGTSKAVLVVDTAGDGFSGISDPDTNNVTHADLANFSFTSGASLGDDLILGVLTAEDVGGGNGFQTAGGGFQAFSTDTSQAGKQFAIYYFPDGSNSAGSSFGFFRTSTVDSDGGNIAYFVPGDGATNTVLSATTSVGGSSTTFNGTPSVSGTIGAVPEPSRTILSMLCLGTLLIRRRRTVA